MGSAMICLVKIENSASPPLRRSHSPRRPPTACSTINHQLPTISRPKRLAQPMLKISHELNPEVSMPPTNPAQVVARRRFPESPDRATHPSVPLCLRGCPLGFSRISNTSRLKVHVTPHPHFPEMTLRISRDASAISRDGHLAKSLQISRKLCKSRQITLSGRFHSPRAACCAANCLSYSKPRSTTSSSTDPIRESFPGAASCSHPAVL